MKLKNNQIIKFDDGEIVGTMNGHIEHDHIVVVDAHGMIDRKSVKEITENRTWEVLAEHSSAIEVLSDMENHIGEPLI